MPRTSKAPARENAPADGRAVAYLRTSPATKGGRDGGESQRVAVRAHAARAGLEVVAEFHDAAVPGADPLDARGGFAALLAHARAHGVGTVIVEAAHHFARDPVMRETGHALLRREGIVLVAADDPDAFAADAPTPRTVRQVLGAVAAFEKASLVARLRGARDRASERAGWRVEGRKSYAEKAPAVVREARRLAQRNPRTGATRSLREIAAELGTLGHTTMVGTAFSATQVKRLLRSPVPRHGASGERAP